MHARQAHLCVTGLGVRRPGAAPTPTMDNADMTEPLHRPTETPPAEGSTAEAHQERPDGGIWEHPYFWLSLIIFGSVVIAAYFIVRIFAY